MDASSNRMIAPYETEGDFPVFDEEAAREAEAAAARRAEQDKEGLLSVISHLKSEVDFRVGARTQIEARWLDDLFQYHGVYNLAQIADMNASDSISRIFINETRSKTKTMAARLSDLLFPTDDRNWAIQATAVPELSAAAKEAYKLLEQAREAEKAAAAQQAQQAEAQQQGGDPAQAQAAPIQPDPKLPEYENRARELDRQVALADGIAKNMSRQIEDQLQQANYAGECRKMIDDAAKIGTGIIKGPIIIDAGTKAWSQDPSTGEFSLRASGQATASVGFVRVDPWSFFPSMTGPDLAEGEGIFERHLMSKADLRRLARTPGFDKNVIRSLLASSPGAIIPAYLSQLRAINESGSTISPQCYEVWEYHGPITGDQLLAVARALGRPELLSDASEVSDIAVRVPSMPQEQIPGLDIPDDVVGFPISAQDEPIYTPGIPGGSAAPTSVLGAPPSAEDVGTVDDYEVDELAEIAAVVWFCGGEMLKFALSPSDRGGVPYSVYTLDPDEASPFGFGVPALIRGSQGALNGAWRMMLDNGGLSAGPQIIINKQKVEPQDGDWTLRPHKVWMITEDIPSDNKAFEAFNIDGHMQELVSVIELALKFMDEEAAIPIIAMGEQGTHTTPTMGGMSILMNAANIIFKRVVKRFDDYVTEPNITRMYDFNMAFSTDGAIKGDMKIDARGSSSLLVKEMMASNLMLILEKFGAHPVFGTMLKSAKVLRALFRVLQMPADESVYTDEELERIMKASQSGPSMAEQLEMKKLDVAENEIKAKIQIANQENDMRLKVAQLAHQTAMMELAAKQNMTLDQIRGKLQEKQAEIGHKERALQAELGAAMDSRIKTPQGGGSI